MVSTWYVTLSALRRYAREAKQAQDKLEDAQEEMREAVDELMEYWKGDGAEAFRAEQEKLGGWFKGLIGIVTEYIGKMIEAAEEYAEREAALASKVHG